MRQLRRPARFLSLAILAAVATAACVDQDVKGDESALLDDAKADSFRRPTDHGPIEFGVPVVAGITATESHHTWTFELAGDAVVDMTTTYAVRGQRKTDTVLYLYKEGPTGWGSYIARNDDYGGTVYSQIIRPLGAGRYRVLVKGYSVSAVGKFQLTVGCTGAGCAPSVYATCVFGATYGDLAGSPALTIINQNVITAASLGTLNPEDQNRLLLAVRESAHTDVMTPLEAIGRVDQGMVNVTWLAEPAARRTFIAFEYGAGDNSYGAIFDRTTGEMAAAIHDGDLYGCATVAETCLLPEDYTALRNDPAFQPAGAQVVTAAAQLDAATQAQALATLRQVYGGDLASIEAGLALADRHQLNVNRYLFVGTSPATALTVVEFGAGDTSVGTIYRGASLDVAGVIEDLFIGSCSLFAGH
ncbi:MAG: DVUA0089 family protein [Kofleriaceae bacterium]